MSETKKKTAAPKPVSKKPYLTGKPLDSSCIGGALRFFLYLLMMAIAFLFLGAVLSFDSFTPPHHQSGGRSAAADGYVPVWRSGRQRCGQRGGTGVSAQGVEPNAQ